MKRVGLYNIEPKIHNTALMKISQYHKDNGDHVEWYVDFERDLYDKIYCSSLFDFTDKSQVPENAICGGTGKTLLAIEIYKQFKNQNPNIEHSFSRARELYRHYLSVMMSSYTDKGDAIKKAIRCFRSQFAVLDDIGAEKPRTEASRMFIEDILEDRYEFAKIYPCCSIITTNLTGEEIGQLYGHRVLDRLHEIFTIMVFNDHSFRQDHTEIIEG